MTRPDSRTAPADSGVKTRLRRPLAWIVGAAALFTILCLNLVWRPSHKDPQVLWNEAQGALQSGNIAGAEDGLAAIHGLRTPTSLDRCLEAQVAVARGRLDVALSVLGLIPEDDPVAGQALLLSGRIQRQRNLTRAAEAAFHKAIASDPNLIEAHRELIYLLGMQLRRTEVDAEFKTLARLTALTHHDLYTWGLINFKFLNNAWTRDTADILQAFIMADPEDRFSRLALASIMLKSPNLEHRMERTLEPLPPSDPEAMALRIELKLQHGQMEDALAMIRDAPEGNPHLSRIRGRIAMVSGDYQAAIPHFQAALSEEHYDRVLLSELGRALALNGDKAASEQYLARARNLDEVYKLLSRIRRPERENQPSDLIELGRSYEAAGLFDEARGWYMLAISRDPIDSEPQKALFRLKQASSP